MRLHNGPRFPSLDRRSGPGPGPSASSARAWEKGEGLRASSVLMDWRMGRVSYSPTRYVYVSASAATACCVLYFFIGARRVVLSGAGRYAGNENGCAKARALAKQLALGNRGQVKRRVHARTCAPPPAPRAPPPPSLLPPSPSSLSLPPPGTTFLPLVSPLTTFFYLCSLHIGNRQGAALL
jgi:hypothetical protein